MGELLELGAYFTAFWAFLFKRDFRRAQLAEFREASRLGRARWLFEAFIATVCGLGVPVFVGWLAITW